MKENRIAQKLKKPHKIQESKKISKFEIFYFQQESNIGKYLGFEKE